nr:hypothetical protein [Mycobacterium kansasii]
MRVDSWYRLVVVEGVGRGKQFGRELTRLIGVKVVAVVVAPHDDAPGVAAEASAATAAPPGSSASAAPAAPAAQVVSAGSAASAVPVAMVVSAGQAPPPARRPHSAEPATTVLSAATAAPGAREGPADRAAAAGEPAA